jgi:two-component system cell cycle response regulator DivK
MTKRILIVEDTEDNRQIVRDLLESAGYELIEALDGLDGVAAAEREQPDLILMDIQLPEVSGLEVTKWLKDDPDLKAIPVVAVTAFAMKGDEERIREGGCEAYLSKPISVGKFIETIRSFLGNA